jgi:hypothetical protein
MLFLVGEQGFDDTSASRQMGKPGKLAVRQLCFDLTANTSAIQIKVTKRLLNMINCKLHDKICNALSGTNPGQSANRLSRDCAL